MLHCGAVLQALAAELHSIGHAPKLLALRELLVQCGVVSGPLAEGDEGVSSRGGDDIMGGAGGGGGHRVLVFAQVWN